MKTFRNILHTLLFVIVILLTGLFITLEVPSVQSRLADKTADWLSQASGAEIQIGSVHFLFFNKLILSDILIISQSDTLLHTHKLSATLGSFNPLGKRIGLRRVLLSDGSFHLITKEGENNISAVFPHEKNKDTSAGSFTWDIRANRVKLERFAYHMVNEDRTSAHNNPHSIDFTNMHVTEITLETRNIRLQNGVLRGRMDHLTAREQSGYFLRHMEGDVTVTNKEALVKNLVIQDDYSVITAHHFLMHYGNVNNLSDYVNKVQMELDMDNAFVSFKSIAYYAGGLSSDFVLDLKASGKVTGTVSNLQSDLLDVHSVTGKTRILCNFLLTGLPIAEESVLLVGIDSLHSDIGDLNHILYSIAAVDLKNLEQHAGPRTAFDFRGRLAGLLTDFVVDGNLRGDFGNLNLDLLINSKGHHDGVLLSGMANISRLDLGMLTGIETLGTCSLYTKAAATIKRGGFRNLHTHIDTLSLAYLEFNNYVFRDFKLLGEFQNGVFDGRMSASDPNLHFLFQGRADLSGSAKATANFFANIAYADLHRLNLYKSDSLAIVSGLVQADFSHINNKGDIDGTIRATDLSLQNSSGTHTLEHFFLESSLAEDGKTCLVTVDSEALKANYTGTDRLVTFLKRLADNNLFSYLPAYFNSGNQSRTWTQDTATLDLTIHNSAFFEELLMPGLYISPGTQLALYDFGNDSIRSVIRSERLGYKEHNLKDLDMLAVAGKNGLHIDLECTEMTVNPFKADTFRLTSTTNDNRIDLDFLYNHKEGKLNSLCLNSQILFDLQTATNTPVITAIVSSDSILFNGKTWSLHTGNLVVSDERIALHNILLQHTGNVEIPEYLRIDGAISRTLTDTLFVELSQFDASVFNTLLPAKYPFEFQGSFTGTGYLTDFHNDRHIAANVLGEHVYINDSLAGDIRLLSSWNPKADHLNLQVSTTLPNGKQPLYATGSYSPSSRNLDIQASFKDFEAALVAPLLNNLVTDVYGHISGDMLLTGTLPHLDLTSQNTRVDNLHFTIDYTKVPYALSGPVLLTREGLFLPRNTLRDAGGNYGIVKGGLHYKHFRDIEADVTLDFVNLHSLNLTEKDNDIFYGQAYATGNLLIKGPFDDILLDISIRPEPFTSIHIPLSSAVQARQTSLLSFTQPEPSYTGRDPYILAAHKQNNQKEKNKNLTLSIKTELTTDAEVLLEINKMTGDIIQARGTGLINLGLDPKDDVFSILGDCSIESGSYLFGLQGIVSKRFQIVPGGSVSFNGGIDNTQLNLTASYKTKASLHTLLADTSFVSNRRDVDCQILMSGNMMNPNLGFHIELDDIDPMTRARVESALSTDDKVMRQFVALLVSSNFIPEQESGIVNNSNLLYSNATEILSNQLNNIFVQLNIPLDVGFNYQPGQSGDIFDVAISTRLFNNRVVINGNMGNNPYTRNENDLVGNVDIELKLGEKGKFRLKAFSHAADQYSNYLDNTQRSGAGFVYQEEFGSFRQLWRRWLKLP